MDERAFLRLLKLVRPLPSKKGEKIGLLPESQGQNLAVTVLYVPSLLKLVRLLPSEEGASSNISRSLT